MECFEFNKEGYNTGEGWKGTTLHMVFDVKKDLWRKFQLVFGGNLIETIEILVFSPTVKNNNLKLLHLIYHKKNIKQIYGNTKNYFPNVYTNEKVFVRR